MLRFATTTALLTAGALIAGSATSAAQAPPLPACDVKPATATFKVCFNDSRKWQVSDPPARITNKENVTIEVVGFNFLKYALTFDVKEEQSEAYQYLVKLWASIVPGLPLDLLSLGTPAGIAPTPKDKLLTAVREVYKSAMDVQATLRSIEGQFTTVGLTLAQRQSLAAMIATLRTQHETLGAKYQALQDLIATDTDVFELAFGKLSTYATLATQVFGPANEKGGIALSAGDRTVRGETRSVGARDAGFRVTVNMIAVDQSGARSQFARVQYVVQTTMPLTSFLGVGVTNASDIDFKTIKRATSLGEDDVFLQQGEGDKAVDLSLYLGWQAYTWHGADGKPSASVLLSLGTGLSEPGKTIMVGPAVVLFDRFVLGGGYAFTREENGQVVTQEPNIYRAIRQSTKQTWYWTLGVRVF